VGFSGGDRWIRRGPATPPTPHRMRALIVSAVMVIGASGLALPIDQAVATGRRDDAAWPRPSVTPTTPAPRPTPSATPSTPSFSDLPPARPGTRTPPVPRGTAPPKGFVRAEGTDLVLDGKPYRFSGFNIYNANSRWNCGHVMVGGGLDRALTDIGAGAEVVRTWFFQSLATTGGERDWTAFDETLAVARAHGVKLIATLTDQWGACESTGVKGEPWYTTGYRTQVYSRERTTYRDFVTEIVTRYHDDPTILMWQLVNEAESKTAAGRCSSVEVLRAFAADVGGLVQRLDPNHLLSLGTIGGGQCATQGRDYKTLHAIPEIDVCEVHDYWDNAPLPGDQWNGFSVRVAQCNELGKPLIVGEMGRRPQTAGGTIATRAAIFGEKFAAQYGAGVDGILLWGWRNADEGGSAPLDYDIGPSDPALVHVRAY
jgi:mannan endo-1,4-beta-mannosidase